MPALKNAAAAIGERVSQVERQVRTWNTAGFDERMAKIEASLESKFQTARKNAGEAANVVAARLRTEFHLRNAGLETRLARLEHRDTEARTQLASVESELSRMKQELARHETRMAAAERNSSYDRDTLEQGLEQRIAAVSRDILSNQRELDRLARNTDTQRVDFEASKSRSRELAPGISLRVTGIDVARRQVRGWMWIMPDRKTVWLKDHSALRPVIFYSKVDGRKREVVFTHVTRDSAVGYLLLPGGAPTEVAARDGLSSTASED
jgi:chromosome segregation ATPase